MAQNGHREFVAYTVVMILLAGALAFVVIVRPAGDDLIALDEGWEYRWSGDEEWRSIDFPSNPPDRAGAHRAAFRRRLPEFSFVDPTLFVYSIDVNAEFSIDGRQVYRYGNIREGRFIGWPWHLIDLSDADSGGMLTVEVFSDYTDIGLFGDILLGERSAQIRRIYRRDIMRFVVCSVSIAIAGIFLGIYAVLRSFRAFLYFALVTFTLAVRVFSLSLAKQLVFEAPMFWEYVRLISYVAMPVTVALSIGEIVGGTEQRITRWIAVGFGVLLVATTVLPLAGAFPLVASYGYVDALAVATLLFLGAMSFRAGLAGNVEAGLITVSFSIVAAFAVYSILMFNGVVPWSDEIDYLMLFQLSAGLLFVLIRRFIVAHRRLQEANAGLEARVAARTRELESANRRLEEEKIQLRRVSTTDGLTGMRTRTYAIDRLRTMASEVERYERRLSVVLFDIDHFKRINDDHGHQSGDLVLASVAGTIISALRESDICGRYGGEEFLLALPETGLQEAAAVAERIRLSVSALRFAGGIPPVTLSGGVAEYQGGSIEDLLKRADVSLYRAKSGGRNIIVA